MNLTISEQAYQNLLTLAQKQGQTPEEALESLLSIEDDPGKVYNDLDAFFRSLGLSQEALDRINNQSDEADPGEYEHADL